MELAVVGYLPDAGVEAEPDWVRWQLDGVTRLIHDVAFDPVFLILDGCEAERDGEFPTAPEDHERPDALGVFYSDGDEEEAERWVEIASFVLRRFGEAIEWESIRPPVMRRHAARAGLSPRCRSLSWSKPQDVIVEPKDMEAIEEAKNDLCDIEVGRLPKVIDELALWPYDLIRHYTGFVCGQPPAGVGLKCLWRDSARYRSVRTGKPAKVLTGWGLEVSEGAKVAALNYAELFRFAYYRFIGSVDWPHLGVDAIRGELHKRGLLDDDC